MIGKAIYNSLINDADISAIIGDRAFPIVVPMDASFPAISFFKSAEEPNKVKTDQATISNDTYQIKCMHSDYESSRALGLLVQNLFDKMRGTHYTIEIQNTIYDGATELYDESAEVFMNILTFNFFYKY